MDGKYFVRVAYGGSRTICPSDVRTGTQQPFLYDREFFVSPMTFVPRERYQQERFKDGLVELFLLRLARILSTEEVYALFDALGEHHRPAVYEEFRGFLHERFDRCIGSVVPAFGSVARDSSRRSRVAVLDGATRPRVLRPCLLRGFCWPANTILLGARQRPNILPFPG